MWQGSRVHIRNSSAIHHFGQKRLLRHAEKGGNRFCGSRRIGARLSWSVYTHFRTLGYAFMVLAKRNEIQQSNRNSITNVRADRACLQFWSSS
ncbi:unnamed protein product [Chondrus crispus]|uniref:Uncharacterized protein n=1 Tax=Chondrus crispus TaxID=2769 RepID=R7QT08_CHOCR|nr:unnamed protein product [Chondrus crispus]CDF40651.1 unnamed protein product [Chondrus crispus]|eukprot:XP_005710945.1 unnamed protein product [Chondrus crispus]